MDKYGFFEEKSYFDKSLSSREGIYLCGFCQSPMDISETVADSSSVASQVATLLADAKYTQLIEQKTDFSQKENVTKIIPSAIIIGGGISGMTAALNLADQGYKAIIIEKDKELGGNLKKIHILYPVNKKASHVLEKVRKDVEDNDKIDVYLESELKEISGTIGNYNVKISDSENQTQSLKIGAIIIATGGQELKPKELFEYNDRNTNVITQSELEQRLINADNEWLKNVNHVTWILCVGARQKDGIDYCSNVCCSNTIKNLNVLEEIKPELQMLVFFRDLHMAKKEYEDFFSEKNKTAKFLRYNPKNLPDITKIGDTPEKYKIEIKDQRNPEHLIEFYTDLIVLSTPMIPAERMDELAKILNVSLDKTGFFLEAHSKLRPLDLTTEGIFLCGCAQWPKNVQESITQARGAAGRAVQFLSLKEISPNKLNFLSFLLSIECHFRDLEVVKDKCNGCGRCIEVCSFKAITLKDTEKAFEDVSMVMKKAVINPAICKGCGKCASLCRLKAISARHYDFDQISSIINPYLLERGERRDGKDIATETS